MSTCCCLNTLSLCNTPVCGTLVLPVIAEAAESGVDNLYSLIIGFLGTEITVKKLQTEGESVVFDISALNENFEYTGTLFNSAGEQVNILAGDQIYDCVKFKTILNVL